MRKICRAALICGAIICTAAAAAVIAACGGKEEHSYAEPIWMWNGTENAAAVFTCTDEGCNASVICTAVIGHSVTPAACETDGADTYTATVTFDGKTYTDVKSFTLAALGHDFGEPEWTLQEGDKGCAQFTCKREGCGITEQIAAGNFIQTETPATCSTDGEKFVDSIVYFNEQTYTHRFNVKIPATGHKYGEPELSWSVKDKTFKAKFTCTVKNCYHVDYVNGSAEYSLVSAAECEKSAKYAATAEFEFQGKEYSIQGTAYSVALGHMYRADYHMYGDDNYTNWPEVDLYCMREGCDMHLSMTATVLSDEIIEQPTCTATGTRRVVATCLTSGTVTPQEYEFNLELPIRHTLEIVYYSNPTCESAGNYDYKRCTECGAAFDYSTEEPISEEDYRIPSYHESREMTRIEYKDGDTHNVFCYICWELIATEPHTYANVNGKQTCTSCGYEKPDEAGRRSLYFLPGKKEWL